MLTVPASERLLVDVAATLSVTLLDGYGEPADAAGAVTVDITQGDGTALVTGGATANPSGTGTYTYALAAGSNTDTQLLTATWKDGGTARLSTVHEVVVGFFFSLAEIEARITDLGDITDGATVQAKARRVRDEVERECERITGTAWVPRYARVRVSGNGGPSLVLPEGIWKPTALRSARIYTSATEYTTFTSDERAAVICVEGGALVRNDGQVWTAGLENIVLEVEHGYLQPPEELKHAAMTRFRTVFNREDKAVPDRAERFVLDGGATFVLAAPGPLKTGLPDVDAVYERWSRRTPGVG